MRPFIAVLAAGLLAAGGVTAADDAVTIKIKQPAAGDVVKETKTEKATNKVTVTVMGTDQVKDETATTKLVYTDEIVERPAGSKRPTKLKRTYETASITKDSETEELGLAGKTVLIEKTGDRYSLTTDGKEVTGKAAEILGKEFGKEKEVTEEDLLPKEPVKVGATWKVDVVKVTKDLANNGMTADPEKSTATGKLVKVYDKGGHRFGVIEINMDLSMTKIGAGGQDIDLKAGSTMKLTATMDACIDGSQANGTSKVLVKGDLSGAVNNVPLKIDLTAVQEGSAEEVKKK
jgi:hypothetical protein